MHAVALPRARHVPRGADGDKQRGKPGGCHQRQVPPAAAWLARACKQAAKSWHPAAWRGGRRSSSSSPVPWRLRGARALGGACWRAARVAGGLRAPATYPRPGAYLPRPGCARWARGARCPCHTATARPSLHGYSSSLSTPRATGEGTGQPTPRPRADHHHLLGKMTTHMRRVWERGAGSAPPFGIGTPAQRRLVPSSLNPHHAAPASTSRCCMISYLATVSVLGEVCVHFTRACRASLTVAAVFATRSIQQ